MAIKVLAWVELSSMKKSCSLGILMGINQFFRIDRILLKDYGHNLDILMSITIYGCFGDFD